MDIKMLGHGCEVKLANGETYVCIRRILEEPPRNHEIVTQELVLVNIFTGVEISLSCYNDDLTHDTDSRLSVKKVYGWGGK